MARKDIPPTTNGAESGKGANAGNSAGNRAGTRAGNGGETHQTASTPETRITTNHGVPVCDNQNSLKAGTRGPTLLEDFILREKIQHFDHERIPERIVHARGSAAHGYFELTEVARRSTRRAKILTEVGEKTEVFIRFSTVAGGAGSVDTPRDVRGFAVKFYTKEGNWDLVGNNIPVFFIQDAIKFPDLVHAVKMEADRGYPQAAQRARHLLGLHRPDARVHPHDHVGDVGPHHPALAAHDRGLRRPHLPPAQRQGRVDLRQVPLAARSSGLQSTCWDEAVKIAGADPDFHRRDLFEAIDSRRLPRMGVRRAAVQPGARPTRFPFDILDATKLIPEELVPIRVVGRMVLNRNPDNFFAETEQVAFLPTNIPPGIDFSDDPLLQGRLFSYLDTQLSRLGTVNFHQMPINRAKGCPFQNLQRDGQMQTQVFKGRANYEPNSLRRGGRGGRPARGSRAAASAASPLPVEGTKVRLRAETFADHYSQARLFFRSQTRDRAGAPGQRARVRAVEGRAASTCASACSPTCATSTRRWPRASPTASACELPPKSQAAAEPRTWSRRRRCASSASIRRRCKGRAVGILVTDGADGALVEAVQTAVRGARRHASRSSRRRSAA